MAARDIIDATALGPDDQPAWRPSTAVAQWLAGKSLDEIEVLEQGGRALYPETLKRRIVGKGGRLEEVLVYVRTPSTRDRGLARRDALRWAGELLGREAPSPLTIEGCKARLGEVDWEHVHNVCLLSHCVLEHAPPHTRYGLPDVLDGHFAPSTLYDLLERMDWWAQQEDPRLSSDQLDEAVVIEVAAAVARRGHTGPLLAIDGLARDSCVVSMARLLTSSRTPKSCLP